MAGYFFRQLIGSQVPVSISGVVTNGNCANCADINDDYLFDYDGCDVSSVPGGLQTALAPAASCDDGIAITHCVNNIQHWYYADPVCSNPGIFAYYHILTYWLPGEWHIRFAVEPNNSFGPRTKHWEQIVSVDPHTPRTSAPFANQITLTSADIKNVSPQCPTGSLVCNWSNATIVIG